MLAGYTRFQPNRSPCGRTRREFFWQFGAGFASLAMIDLLTRDGVFDRGQGDTQARLAAAETNNPAGAVRNLLSPKPAHFPPKAKRVIFFFMNGGPSQVDTFDPKPALAKYQGKPYSGKLQIGSNGRAIGHPSPSAFKFKKHGQSGLEISSLFPYISTYADDLCVIRSMHTDTPTHSPGILQMNTGSIVVGKPSLGAWLSYGLGTENENLPSFVVMVDSRGGPRGGAAAWSAGFMPAVYQGTMFRGTGSPLLDLAAPSGVGRGTQRRSLDLLARLNQIHLDERPGNSELAARLQSYELAYKMQTAAAEAVDIDKETERTKEQYGLNRPLTAEFGRKCLLSRRLLERGVRFIQLYSGGSSAVEASWDAHQNCITNHKLHAGETDQPMAALITDLKRTGLWEDTLLVWGGEFGRTPTSEGVGKPGRDHNHYGFSMWLAGAGVRGGQAIGATDELGFEAVEQRCHVSDLHATILHLLGLDHNHLTFLHEGLEQRLTGVKHRHVIKQVLA